MKTRNRSRFDRPLNFDLTILPHTDPSLDTPPEAHTVGELMALLEELPFHLPLDSPNGLKVTLKRDRKCREYRVAVH